MRPPSPALLLCLLSGAAPLAAAQEAAPSQEAATDGLNIVLILADDLGIGDVGCYGGSLPTPNIDALAAGGTRFAQAYVTAPTCGPSRAALLTGRYQQRCGFEFNTRPGNVKAHTERGLPPEATTLTERLRELDHATALIGKWHLGFRDEKHPLARGFQEFFGFLGGERSYLPGTPWGRSSPLMRGLARVDEPEYLTDAFAREAVDFIRRNAQRPFFLYAAFNAPHRPYEATEEYLARFPDLKGTARVYAAMVSALDDAVGRILAALDEESLAERTLVVFASDNGAVLVDGAGSNGSLRLGKFFLFEGGVRVPLIVRDPRAGAGGRVVDQPVSSLDLFPTLLAAAGGDLASAGPLDGRDLAPTLRGEASRSAQTWLAWRVGSCSALRKGELKLVRSGEATWLFDLGSDPGEERDLLDERGDTAGELAAELDRWSAGLRLPLWEPTLFNRRPLVCGKTYVAEY